MAAKRKKKAKRAKKRTAKRATKRRTTKKRATKKRTKKRTTKRKVVKRKKKAVKRKKKAAKRTVKRRTKRKAAKKKKKSKRKPNLAFMAPVQPDAKLAAVVGSTPLPRTQLTKKLWAYIKRKGLQDKRDRRMINADANLKAVFNGKSQVSMFEMTKLVSRHVR